MRHLEVAQIDEIVECTSEVKYDRDEMIIREGEVGFKVFVIEGMKGSIRCYVWSRPTNVSRLIN